MQRFNRVANAAILYFDEIVKAKQSPRRQLLQSLRPQIMSRYAVYATAGQMLETITRLQLPSADVHALEHCYGSRTDALDGLKVTIRTVQEKVWRQLCPYCGIDTSSTFDHYLCQKNFPDFAVLCDNLIPACSICNTKKGDKELDGGQRRFIHFYVDEIPDARWLHCRIVVINGDPEAHFEVSFPPIVPVRMQEIIGEHYRRLELTGRFGEKAVQKLVEALLTGHRDTMDGYAREFANRADRLGDAYGHNHWESRLYDAMAQSEPFLQLLV